MEDRDSKPALAGIDFAATGFSAALRNLQVFTEEIGRVSRTSFAQNSKLIDELSSARDVGDFVAIQTKFMTGMFETFNEHVRLMMSHMTDLPLGMAFPAEVFSGAAADSVQRAKSAVEEAAASMMPDAGLEPHANGAAGPGDAQAGIEAAQTAVHAGSEAAQTTVEAGGEAAQTALEAGREAAQTTVEAGSEAAHQAVEGAGQSAESGPAADETPPIPKEYTPAATTLYASFVAGAELGEAELAAAQEASESAVESTEWAAKASREAWEELAKAAAELLKADPAAEAPASASDAEGEASQPSSTD